MKLLYALLCLDTLGVAWCTAGLLGWPHGANTTISALCLVWNLALTGRAIQMLHTERQRQQRQQRMAALVTAWQDLYRGTPQGSKPGKGQP